MDYRGKSFGRIFIFAKSVVWTLEAAGWSFPDTAAEEAAEGANAAYQGRSMGCKMDYPSEGPEERMRLELTGQIARLGVAPPDVATVC